MPLPAFAKTLRGILVLLLLVAGWCAALWFLIAPDFSQWSMPRLALSHAGPPLLVWSGWRFWCRRRQQRKSAAAVRKEELAEQERLAARAAVQEQNAAEWQRLRYGCDCRALAVAQLATVAPDLDPVLLPENDACHVSLATADTMDIDAADGAGDPFDHLRPAVEEALLALYERCPAASVFPVYVVPPAQAVGEQVIALVRQIRSGFQAGASDLFLVGTPESETSGAVLFLPPRDSVADGVIGLFENSPELPGAVVLAFDSPLWQAQRSDDAMDAPAEDVSRGRARQMPGQGAFALLLTSPRLPQMLTGMPSHRRPHDPMTPYWERNAVASTVDCLSVLTDSALQHLAQCDPVARVHRTAQATFDPGAARQLELARGIEALIERAQVHAGLVEPAKPEKAGEQAAENTEEPSTDAVPGCGWLIHNAGNVASAGYRLASLGCALVRRGLDVDPIESATDVALHAGDLGQARGVAMLALTIARVADGPGGVLCAEFCDDGHLSLYFAMPTPAAA
jgi:hypothetical protein